MTNGKRPNVIWFCTDQQRFDTIAALGNPVIRTPNIDALVAEGAAFTRAYVQNPVCTPSRASFMTGRYPAAHRVNRNGAAFFPHDEKLVSKCFADEGYRCGLIGKLHLTTSVRGYEARSDDGYATFLWSNSHRPEDGTSINNAYHQWLRARGIDPWELYEPIDAFVGPGAPDAQHQTTWVGEAACDFIGEAARDDRPWFLNLNPFGPHHPFDPPPEYLERMDEAAMPDPLFRETDLDRQQQFAHVQHHTTRAVNPLVRPEKEEPILFEGSFANSVAKVDDYYGKRVIAHYYASIEHIDDVIGRVVAALKASGQYENTIIVFTSDHGELLGDHGLIFKGCRFFEGAVRVPLVISWPAGFRSGLWSDALVESIDIAPTLLEAAGIAIPERMQGISLAGILRGEAPPDRHKDIVVCDFNRSISYQAEGVAEPTHGSMTFDGRYKLIAYHDLDLFELFDLQEDPGEFDNIWEATDPALRLKLLSRHMDTLLATADPGPGVVRVAGRLG